MTKQIKDVLERNGSTILADALGAAALLVILFGGLSLPAIL